MDDTQIKAVIAAEAALRGAHATSREGNEAIQAALKGLEDLFAAAYQASALPLPAEREAAILEATQEIRDIGRDLIENDWSTTGESLTRQALKIERNLLAATPLLVQPEVKP